jgi:thiamine kinase-like enzyme
MVIDLTWSEEDTRSHIMALPCFSGVSSVQPLVGGLCNRNFVVEDAVGKFVVRIGGDIWVHGISQVSVQNAMRAAATLGVTPMLRYAEAGLVVTDFVTGRALRAEDVADEAILADWVARLRELHDGVRSTAGAMTYFWPFQVVRHYLHYCRANKGPHLAALDDLDSVVDGLEKLVKPYRPVFTHNDVVPQNAMIDLAGRVQLIDWDYGGFGHPYFDVSGIATNADAGPEVEARVIELYEGEVTPELWRTFRLFKVAVSLREYLWGIAQELSSDLDAETVGAGMAALYPDETPGYSGYADMNRRRYEHSLAEFRRFHQ